MKARRFVSSIAHTLMRMTMSSKQRSDEAAGKILSPAETFPESDYIKRKRQEAIAKMGKGWILHPEYQSVPRHSNHLHIWWPHRTLRGATAC